MIGFCSFSIIKAYEEMGGENEETIKKQVVVHLTLQEYEVGEMMNQAKKKLKKLTTTQ